MQKFILSLLMLGLLLACSHRDHKKPSFHETISQEEARSLKEVRAHANELIEIHPELDADTKEKISKAINDALSFQENLKNHESKMIQEILTKKIEPTAQNSIEMKKLKRELKSLYEKKSENVLNLIALIDQLHRSNKVSDGFTKDMTIFFREFR